MILVTGASGFIGRSLCSTLRERHFEVRGVSRSKPEFEHIGDLSGETNWTELLSGVEVVVHLAARVHIDDEQSVDPLAEYRRVNRDATLNLARQAAAAGVKRLVFMSSIHANGKETTNAPFTEDTPPRPVDHYGVSKHEAEEGLKSVAAETGIEITTIRPPIVYGPGVAANFRSMMGWLTKGVPLPLGAVRNARSLVAMDNLVDLTIRCIDHPAAANQVFLAADGEDLSTPDLLRRVGAALGRPARLIPVPVSLMRLAAWSLGRSDVARRLLSSLQIDIGKARKVLDWQPPVSVDAAIDRTAKAYLAELERS